MKKIFLIFLSSISIYSQTFAQDNLSEEKKISYLTNPNFKLTPSEIVSNFRETNCSEWYYDDRKSSPYKSAYELNVLNYFSYHIEEYADGKSYEFSNDLYDKYDSPLKIEVYKKTNEYKFLLDSLKKIRNAYLNSMFFDGENKEEEKDESLFESKEIKYDLDKKGFDLPWDKVFSCGVEFRQLPSKREHSSYGSGWYDHFLIPMDADNALEIENNRGDVRILWVFNVQGGFYLYPNSVISCTAKGGNIRLIIYNKQTEIIYYDHLFKELPPNNKK